jgi:hypothetical protein
LPLTLVSNVASSFEWTFPDSGRLRDGLLARVPHVKSDANHRYARCVAWTVRLINEDGAKIAETSSTDDAALARAQELPDSYPRLAEIDPFGDTVFNRLQVPRLIGELEALLKETESRSEQQWLLDVLALAEQCRDSVHVYLKLLGE